MPDRATGDAAGIIPDVLGAMQNAMMLNPIMKPQAEQFWAAQEKLLDEAELFARHWFERRHEAAQTALAATLTATTGSGGSPAAAMRALTEWQRQSAERIAEDGREWVGMVSRCATCICETEAEAVKEALDEAVERARDSAKASKSEPV
ncbi:hypothetical protein [Cribrihabitans neustonicus]|uniref:hypothetical protein n=1 Tax=Cribrihabitans neustonicus TaxID=1429085 RepID=UPI003B5A597C